MKWCEPLRSGPNGLVVELFRSIQSGLRSLCVADLIQQPRA